MKRIFFLLIMIFSISCNIVINPDIFNPNHNKKTYKVLMEKLRKKNKNITESISTKKILIKSFGETKKEN